MKKIYLLLTFLLINNFLFGYTADDSSGTVVNASLPQIWHLWDDCDSHKWQPEAWGGTLPDISCVNFDNHKCLKVYFSTGPYGVIRTDWDFYPENWEVVGAFEAEIYVVDYSSADVKLEVVNSTGGTVGTFYVKNLSPNTWNDVNWAFTENISSHVSRVYITFDDLPTTPTTFYVDNLSLITIALITELWDNMDDLSNEWVYSGDVSTWSPTYEAITHNQTTSTSPAGAIYLRWKVDTETDELPGGYAKVTSGGNLNADWSNYKSIRAQIYCSTDATNIKVGFWDGANYLSTTEQAPAAANSWVTLEWNLPTGTFNWTSVDSIEFIIATDIAPEGEGEIYIDNISFGERKVLP